MKIPKRKQIISVSFFITGCGLLYLAPEYYEYSLLLLLTIPLLILLPPNIFNVKKEEGFFGLIIASGFAVATYKFDIISLMGVPGPSWINFAFNSLASVFYIIGTIMLSNPELIIKPRIKQPQS